MIEDLELDVKSWAANRGIFVHSDAHRQAMKTDEELSELFDAIGVDDKELIKDAYGDILVTLIIGMHFYKLTMRDCLQHAYDEIKHRTGEMKDGFFVKHIA